VKRGRFEEAPPHPLPRADDLPDWLKDVADGQLSTKPDLATGSSSSTQSTSTGGTDNSPFSPEAAFKVLEIPANLKSGIIGKGGHLINYIRRECQSDIQIQNPAPGSNFATIMIRGNIAKAEKMIGEQIAGLQKNGDSEEWTQELIECPQHLVALVVGPQGKKVHELMEKCGCLIKFVQMSEVYGPDAPPGRQICRIKGPKQKLEYGMELVREQIGLAARYDRKKKENKFEEQAQRFSVEGCNMPAIMGGPPMGGPPMGGPPMGGPPMGGMNGMGGRPPMGGPFPQQTVPFSGGCGKGGPFPQQTRSGPFPQQTIQYHESGPFPQQWQQGGMGNQL
jgi:hypothetical protein